MPLLALPTEILVQILSNLPYTSLLPFLATSKSTHTAGFAADHLLWRAVFLHSFDDLRHRRATLTATARAAYDARFGNIDWRDEVRRRVVALRCLRDANAAEEEIKSGERHEELVEVLLDILDTARVPSTLAEQQQQQQLSLNASHFPSNDEFDHRNDAFMLRTAWGPNSSSHKHHHLTSMHPSPSLHTPLANLWRWDPSPTYPMTRSRAARTLDSLPRSAALSRLHVLRGLTAHERADEKAAGRARRIMYDWSLTHAGNEWGPWREGDGAVDWRRLEACVGVVLRMWMGEVGTRLIVPSGFGASLPWRTVAAAADDGGGGGGGDAGVHDWAGVTGTWLGTYVFMHWEDLVEYNEFRDTSSRPTLEHMGEACGGLMRQDLEIDMSLREHPSLQTQLPVCMDLPPLYFRGASRSEDWQMATGIRGMCCLAPGGREVRWRYIVYYGGADQWLLEGVQPGGIRSGCVYGTWTSTMHEPMGPVGPFFYAPKELCRQVTRDGEEEGDDDGESEE